MTSKASGLRLRLVIAISADPDASPDLDRLQQELQRQLDIGLRALHR